MPIYSPTGFLDITNATLRTSNTECQNLKIGTGNLYVTSEISPTYELNLSNVTSLGATSPHTLILSNVTTAIDATSNIITSGNLKIGGLIYTKDWGIRAASGSNDLYVGRFTVHGITEVLITDQGASLGSASKYTITRNVNSTPLVNGIDSSSTINYDWYFKSHDSTTYDLWVRPTSTVQTNIKVTSSTYIELGSEPSSSGAIACVNGLINMSGNVVANQNLTVTANVEVGGELTVTGNVSDLNVVSNVNMLHTSNTASIKLNSNVVAEFPRSKKLIKYPREAIPGNNSGVGSGYTYSASDGDYVIKASSEYDTRFYASNAFDSNQTTFSWISTATRYTSGNPITSDSVASSTFAKFGAYGEWLELKIPTSIYLNYVVLYPMEIAVDRTDSKARSVIVWGSNTGSDGAWQRLSTVSDIGDYSESTPLKISVESRVLYNYYALQITTINPIPSQYAVVNELQFWGTPEYDPEAHGTDVTVKSVANVPNTDWLEVYYDAKGLTDISSGVSDLSGKSINGVVTGATLGTDENIDIFNFDGQNDIIQGTFSGHTLSSGYTMATWIKPGDIGADDYIATFGVGSTGTAFGINFETVEGAFRAFIWGSSTNVAKTGPGAVTKDKWVHIAATFISGDGTIHLYIDNKLVATGTGTALSSISSSTPLVLGARNDAFWWNYRETR